MEARKDSAASLVVVAVSLAVAALYYTGLYCSDDTRYLMGAIRIALGEGISVESLAERRAVFLLPASAIYALTREIDSSIAIYASFYVALAAVLYVLARHLFDTWTAACVALVGLAQPTLFLYSGALLPDIPAAFFLSLSMLFLLKLEVVCSDTRLGWGAFLLGLACGSSVAVAFTIKESSAVVAPIIASFMAVCLCNRRTSAWLRIAGAAIAGFLCVILLEALLFKIVAGTWYSSFHSLLKPHDFTGFTDVQGRTVAARFRSLYGQLGHYTAILFLLAAISSCRICYEWAKGSLRAHDLGAWLVIVAFWAWPTFYFTFGTASLTEYSFPVMQQRYYAPCVPPAALLAGRLFAPLFRTSASGLSRAFALLTFFAFLTAPVVNLPERGLIYGAAAKESFLMALHSVRSTNPDIPVVDTDSGWTTDLNRCRALLLSDTETGHQRLMEIIHDATDRKSRFGYPDVRRLNAPFVLLGHGDVLDDSKGWVQHLRQRVVNREVRVDFLGQYDAASCATTHAYRFLPRGVAVQRCVEGEGSITSHEDKAPSPNSTSAYLVTHGGLHRGEGI